MFPFELIIFLSEIDDKETEQGNDSKWKESLIARARTRQNINLMQLVYEHSSSNSEAIARVTEGSNSEDSDDEEFFIPKKEWDKVRQPLFILTCYLTCYFLNQLTI